MNEEYKKYKFLVEKPEGRDNLGQQGGTGEDNIKVDDKGTLLADVHRSYVA
jgi:hypothetical protein